VKGGRGFLPKQWILQTRNMIAYLQRYSRMQSEELWRSESEDEINWCCGCGDVDTDTGKSNISTRRLK
jgi:hypothetical protein